jgi:ADP-heptose:LPS heptosyltransferase
LETFTPPDQEFIPFGKIDNSSVFDIVIHARNRTDAKAWPEKNWPVESWDILIKYFHTMRIACVGHPKASFKINGTEDLRGIPLSKVADVLASSKLCVGCSDGLLNFAALCKTPRIVWTTKSEATKNIDRHTRCWNPFNAPVKMIVHNTWRPDVLTIIAVVEQYFEENHG